MSYPTARRAAAVATSLAAFISYLLTAAPSVTFWRPSELSAAASVLGLPLPPASPLWLLLARIAQSILPGDAAGASTLLSSICSAITAGLVVLIVCMLVERWLDREHDALTLPAVGGGVIAGLAFAWSDSQWRAATITASEPLAVLLVAAALVLTLRWSERADEPGGIRWLLGAAFALGLLGGVEPRLLVVAPALGSIVFFRAVRPTPASIGAALAVSLVGGWLFDRLATTWLPSLLDGSSWFIILGVPVLLGVLLSAWSATSEDKRPIAVAVAACGLALLGASTVLVIPIRGAAHPPTSAYAAELDEPVARMVGVDAASDAPFWPRRWSIDPERRRFQDRYGSWSPAALNDPMEASIGAELRFLWHYQLSHMYLRYLLWNVVGRASDNPDAPPAWFAGSGVPQEVQQTGTLANPFPVRYFALPLILALIGFGAQLRRDPRMAVALALLFALGGIGVVVTVSLQQPQPRERDLLYLASYFVVALWIGLGAAALASRMPRRDDADSAGEDRIGAGLGAVALGLLAGPVNMLLGGWSTHDRSASVIAWDYAYNLLQSCDSNAVLLTAGDNDTFPLLYLQDAEGIRRDVRVVNIRMANDPAYLRRVSTERRWGSDPLGLSIVEALPRDASKIDVEVAPPATVTVDPPGAPARPAGDTSAADSSRPGAMTWILRGPAVGAEGLQMVRLQERAIVDLLRQNRWRRPIYFAASVPSSERAGLDAFLRREGLALRVVPERQQGIGREAVDTARTRRALLTPLPGDTFHADPHDGFKLRGLASAESYLEPEERRVISLYRHLYLVLAERELVRPRSAPRVRELLGAMEDRIPSAVHPMPYWMSAAIATLYWRAGDPKESRRAAARAVDAVDAMGDDWRRHPHARTYHPIQVKAQMLALLDEYERAIDAYRSLQKRYPNDAHLRGQLEELRIERHLTRRDTTAALAEIDAIVAGYAGTDDPALQNNAAAFRALADELRGIDEEEKGAKAGRD